MKRTLGFTAVAVALIACSGCGRAITEGVGLARGAKGIVVVVAPAPSLAGYAEFKVEAFNDQTGSGVPQVVKDSLAAHVAEQLAEAKVPTGGAGKTLIIRGTYLYYEDANNTADQVFGPLEEVLARVQLVDAASGKVLGEANCVGRTTASVNKGPNEKGQGLAKAIVKWIKREMPG